MKKKFELLWVIAVVAVFGFLLATCNGGNENSGTTYSVTYNGNENTGGTVPTDSTPYPSGVTVTILGNQGNLVKTGHTFAGWNATANGSGAAYK